MTCASGKRGNDLNKRTILNAKSFVRSRSCSGVMLTIGSWAKQNHNSQLTHVVPTTRNPQMLWQSKITIHNSQFTIHKSSTCRSLPERYRYCRSQRPRRQSACLHTSAARLEG